MNGLIVEKHIKIHSIALHLPLEIVNELSFSYKKKSLFSYSLAHLLQQTSTISSRISPPNSSSGSSGALPVGASWYAILSMHSSFKLILLAFLSLVLYRGVRPSSSQPLLTSTPSSNAPANQKIDSYDGPVAFSKSVPSLGSSFQNDTGKKKVPNEEGTVHLKKSKTETLGPAKKESEADGSIVTHTSTTSVHPDSVPLNSQLHSPARTKSILNASNSLDSSAASSGPVSDKDPVDYVDNNNMEKVQSRIMSLSIKENQHSQNSNVEHIREPSIGQTSGEVRNTTDKVHTESFRSDSRSEVTKVDSPELEDDLLSFHNQRTKDPEIASSRAPDFNDAFNLKHSDYNSSAFDNADGLTSIGIDRQIVDRSGNLMVSTSNLPSMYLENTFNNGAGDSNLFLRKEKMSQPGRYEIEVGGGATATDMGESSIISNILSLDFDSWDESVTSPQNLAKLLGETDRRQGSFGAPGSWKTQNSSQSRFSFAREEEVMNHMSCSEQSINYHEQALKQRLFGHNFSGSNGLHLEKFVGTNGLPVSNGTEQDYYANNFSHFSSNKFSGKLVIIYDSLSAFRSSFGTPVLCEFFVKISASALGLNTRKYDVLVIWSTICFTFISNLNNTCSHHMLQFFPL